MRSLTQAPLAGSKRSVVAARTIGALVLAALASLTFAAAAGAADVGHTYVGSFNGSGPEQLGTVGAIEVDNSGGPSDGDVYVADTEHHRVEKFDAEGNFILMFGEEVDATTGADVCTAVSGDTCKEGKAGVNSARLNLPYFLAISPVNGDVYVEDLGESSSPWSSDDNIHKYDENGVLQTDWGALGWVPSTSQSSYSLGGMAVNAAGDLIVYNKGWPEGGWLTLDAGDGTVKEKVEEPTGCGSHYEIPGGIAVGPTGAYFYETDWGWTWWGAGEAGESLERFEPGSGCTELTGASWKPGKQEPPNYEIQEGVATGMNVDRASGTMYRVEETQVSEWQVNGSGEPLDREGNACPELCAATHVFGDGDLSEAQAIGVGASANAVYVADKGHHGIAIFAATPLPKATTGDPTGNHTVAGEVDPNGNGPIVECYVEFGLEAVHGGGYGSRQDCDQSTPISSPTAVTADLPGVYGETTYHYRFVAVNEEGGKDVGADNTITPHPIDGLTTEAATAVSRTKATLHASFEGNGEETFYYFEWGTDTGYGDTSAAPPGASAGSPTAPPSTALSFTAENLEPATTYHYRVVAENAEGATRGQDMTFETAPAVQSVATEPASSIGPKSATLNGSYVGDGDMTSYYYEYGEGENYGSTTPVQQVGAATGPTSLPATVSGLALETTYHYRVVVTNGLGTTRGADQTFQTEPAVAGVATKPASAIGQDHITLNGEFAGNGEDTHYYFEYGKTTAYGMVSEAAPGSDAGSPTGATAVSSQITDFEDNSTYHFRVVFANSFGVTYGNDVTFNAPPSVKPTISGTGFSDLNPHGATLEAQVNPNRSATLYAFEYGVTSSYGSSTEISKSIGADSAFHLAADVVADMLPNTTYHYRAVAINFAGTVYGPDQVLTTPDLPSIGGAAASGVEATSVHLSASVNPHWSATVVRFEYGLTDGYGSTTDGQGVGSDSATHGVGIDIGGLRPETTYHFRPVATNAFGTTVGPDQTFTTASAEAVPAPPEPPGTHRCRKGFVKRHGKCVKKPKRHRPHHRSTHRHG